MTDFPGVRAMLERWRVLPPNSPRNAVASIGIDIRKVVVTDDDPVGAVERFLEKQPTDLVVLAADAHLLDALRGSTTERVLRGGSFPLLAIPAVQI